MKYQTEDMRWVHFYPQFNSSLFVEKAGYFDERPQLHTSITQLVVSLLFPILLCFTLWALLLIPFMFFGWGTLYIHLPIKTGIQDCDSAAWGFNYHNNTIWIYIGGAGNFEGGRKWKSYPMPWELYWVRTSTLLNDGTWFNETSTNRLDWTDTENKGSYNWLKKTRWQETYPYTDSYDGTKLNATVHVQEREWRPRGLKWTNLFSKTKRVIEIEFDEEVGNKKGSWKGGVMGCSYELKLNEAPLECLRRMETERKFN